MNILILADRKMEILSNLKNIFRKLKIDNELHILKPSDGLEILYKKLRGATHLLVFVSEDISLENWFVFSIAFCLGIDKSVFLFLRNDKLLLPEFYRENIKCSTNIEELENFYQVQLIKWEKKILKENAVNELGKMGYSFSEESFFNAVAAGEEEAVGSFLTAGFSAGLSNREGVPLLSIAVRNNHRNLISLLLTYGASINAVSRDRGNTALMDAASIPNEEIVSDLIHGGADLDVRSKNGQTALMLAVGQNDFKTSDLILRAGADVSIEDNLGLTAKKYAELFKNDDIIKIIRHSE